MLHEPLDVGVESFVASDVISRKVGNDLFVCGWDAVEGVDPMSNVD